jgi:phage shock protein PspC (stress-responsive transcriptional regulator)
VARRDFPIGWSGSPAPFREAARRGRELIAGVCGGIADFLGWDPTLVRIGYVVVSVASAAFPGLLAYIVLWIVMPKEPA